VLPAVALLATMSCRGSEPAVSTSDVAAAERFVEHPVYWLGERFEQWELAHVDVTNPNFVQLVYGTCEVNDPDGILGPEGGSCSPPLQLQISPLCAHLPEVARAPIWKRRAVRGAPVGTIDSAPVLFTRGAQVKVYRGQGSDAGLPMRALRALRSLNKVEPVIDARGPIPPPPTGVLAGTRPCTT
jgi:hypothetical protein